jgi:peptidoglycan/xylan/chitin deacetylase (PgdA/CDA1 family)
MACGLLAHGGRKSVRTPSQLKRPTTVIPALKTIARSAGLDRRRFAAARMCCERHVLASVGRQRKRWIGRILCYHSVGQGEFGVNDVTPSQFRRHIELALANGYRFVPASEIVASGGQAKDLAITFDDGLRTVLTTALPILQDFGIPFSAFPVSEWSEGANEWARGKVMDWRDLEVLLNAGAELGSHSATHPDFGAIGEQQMIDELGGSRDLIQKRLGFAPKTFAIPMGQSTNWKEIAGKAAREAGYEVIFAQAEETRPQGTVARTFVTKFDGDRIFKSLLKGKYDYWEEWV